MSFVAIPATGICPRYFKRNRALASGISVAGSSLGGVLWPVACDQLLHKDGISFNWTIRIIGFVMLPLLVIVILTVRPPLQPQQKIEDGAAGLEGKVKVDRAALRKEIRKPPFILLCSGLFLAYLGFFSPFFFVSTYATHLGMSQRLAFYLVSMINGASLVGRILPGFVADRMGRFNLLTASALFGGIIAFCWTTATSVAGLILWSIAYGFASGVGRPNPYVIKCRRSANPSTQAIMSLQLACGTILVNENVAAAAIGAAMGSTSLA